MDIPRQLKCMGVNTDSMERLWYPLYDTLSLGEHRLVYFAAGAFRQGKTYADTNMDLDGHLPSFQYFHLRALELYVAPESKTQVIVESRAAIRFVINNKIYSTLAPLLKAVRKGGVSMPEVLISPSTYFYVEVLWHDEVPKIKGRLCVTLLGDLYRPCQ